MKIAIDAGHGLKTLGKRCLRTLDPRETREWVLNDRIADILQDLLAKYECETLRVDDVTGANDVALYKRVKTANDAKVDMYISIHHNAGIKGGVGGGMMVFHYNTARSAAQATRLYSCLITMTGLVGNRANPVAIGNHLYVIKHTNMPCYLIEAGFMDSKTDTPIVLTAEHAQKTAEGICSFLVKELSLKPKKVVNGANTEPYRVIVTADSLNVRAGAGTSYKVNTTIKKGGVYTIVDEKDGWGKLKSGAGWISLNYTKKC